MIAISYYWLHVHQQHALCSRQLHFMRPHVGCITLCLKPSCASLLHIIKPLLFLNKLEAELQHATAVSQQGFELT